MGRKAVGTLADMAATLVQLRLPAFKSVRRADVRLEPLTLLVGRNSSGKSNVIDALAVLSALATGSSIREALDGGRHGPLVRGGSEGCAPLGRDSFEIGCAARIDSEIYRLDVTISVRPPVQVLAERLWTRRSGGSRGGEPQDLLLADPPRPDSGDITVRWDNRRQGPNPAVPFRATQLLTSQVAARIPARSEPGRHLHHVAEQMLSALREVFILDPVPHQMREYVPRQDTRLRRNADNLSATLASLMRDDTTRLQLLSMMQSLSENDVAEMGAVTSDLGDVMAYIRERIGNEPYAVPARLMSDGTLRFLAIAAAVLDEPSAEDDASGNRTAGRLLVVEEIENGLHPSQVGLLLERLKTASDSGTPSLPRLVPGDPRRIRTASDAGTQTLATTHSPAILDALNGRDHEGVLVCHRNEDGWTTVTGLTDFPDYLEVAGGSTLGASAIRDRLRPRSHMDTEQRSLVDVLGL